MNQFYKFFWIKIRAKEIEFRLKITIKINIIILCNYKSSIFSQNQITLAVTFYDIEVKIGGRRLNCRRIEVDFEVVSTTSSIELSTLKRHLKLWFLLRDVTVMSK